MEKRVLFTDFYVCADVPKQLSNNFLSTTFSFSPTGITSQGFPYRDNYPCQEVLVALMLKKRSDLKVGGGNFLL
jgi:hypothetical protein